MTMAANRCSTSVSTMAMSSSIASRARFILRRGKLTGCVVNKGFAGGGERLESGNHHARSDARAQRSRP